MNKDIMESRHTADEVLVRAKEFGKPYGNRNGGDIPLRVWADLVLAGYEPEVTASLIGELSRKFCSALGTYEMPLRVWADLVLSSYSSRDLYLNATERSESNEE